MLPLVSGWRSQGFTDTSVPVAYDRYVRRQLFDPWARDLVVRAELQRAMSVLDVACGPGTVARQAASAVGATGRVVATDVSAAMLEVAAAAEGDGAWAKVEYLQCPADALAVGDGTFDRVLCQQGLQFFPDRVGALREMHRVLAPGGVVLLGVWASERPLGLFGPIAETVAETSAREPYPHAFSPDSYTIGAASLRELLAAAEFAEVSVELVELECSWASAEEVLASVLATPFGPLVSALDAPAQERIREGLRERLGLTPDARPTVTTVANVARAVK